MQFSDWVSGDGRDFKRRCSLGGGQSLHGLGEELERTGRAIGLVGDDLAHHTELLGFGEVQIGGPLRGFDHVGIAADPLPTPARQAGAIEPHRLKDLFPESWGQCGFQIGLRLNQMMRKIGLARTTTTTTKTLV